MVTIKIYLRTYGSDPSTGVVWLSFYVNREKVNFSTKVSVDLKNWNDKKKCVGVGDKQCNDKNLIIENILARINNVFVKYRLRDRKLTRDAFRLSLKPWGIALKFLFLHHENILFPND